MITTVTSKPTTASPIGIYKVIDEQGLYWGHWSVARTWTGEISITQYLPEYQA